MNLCKDAAAVFTLFEMHTALWCTKKNWCELCELLCTQKSIARSMVWFDLNI